VEILEASRACVIKRDCSEKSDGPSIKKKKGCLFQGVASPKKSLTQNHFVSFAIDHKTRGDCGLDDCDFQLHSFGEGTRDEPTSQIHRRASG